MSGEGAITMYEDDVGSIERMKEEEVRIAHI
jgi:hypothetical protein